jgi:hypothetical protein
MSRKEVTALLGLPQRVGSDQIGERWGYANSRLPDAAVWFDTNGIVVEKQVSKGLRCATRSAISADYAVIFATYALVFAVYDHIITLSALIIKTRNETRARF